MKKRKVIKIIIIVVVAILIIVFLCKAFMGLILRRVDKRVDDRLAKVYSETNVPKNDDSFETPTASEPEDTFTDVSWPEESIPTSSKGEVEPEKKFSATIANTEKANDKKVFRNLAIYDNYDEAFDSVEEMPSGRHVTITIDSNIEVKNITGRIGFYNPDSEEFETQSLDFETSVNSSNDQFRLKFKVPQNPHIDQCFSGKIEIVMVFEVTTAEGTRYVSCAY